jgi:hypothetical protein
VETHRLYVVQLSTNKTWFVKARATVYYRHVFAISPTEIVLGESDKTGSTAVVERLVRLRIDALDALAEK